MAIIEYKTGEHPGGFVGFRVVRTLGSQFAEDLIAEIVAEEKAGQTVSHQPGRA